MRSPTCQPQTPLACKARLNIQQLEDRLAPNSFWSLLGGSLFSAGLEPALFQAVEPPSHSSHPITSELLRNLAAVPPINNLGASSAGSDPAASVPSICQWIANATAGVDLPDLDSLLGSLNTALGATLESGTTTGKPTSHGLPSGPASPLAAFSISLPKTSPATVAPANRSAPAASPSSWPAGGGFQALAVPQPLPGGQAAFAPEELLASRLWTNDDNFIKAFDAAFVAEGRIGNNALNGTHELDIAASTGGPFAAGNTANYVWPGNNAAVPFKLTYNAGTATATFVNNVGAANATTVTYAGVTWPPSALDGSDVIFVRIAASKPDSSLQISNLQIKTSDMTAFAPVPNPGDNPLGAASIQTVGPNTKKTLEITGANLRGGFELTGVSFWNFQNSGANKPANSQLAFQIKVGASKYVADLDVNGNKTITDAVDGTVNYLPGYEGNTAKVSENNTFNTAHYTGQKMKLVVDGAGTNSAITEVIYEITEVTSYDGYSGNTTDESVVGENRQEDYSFKEIEDSRQFTVTRATTEDQGGQMEADKAWVDFWCKDYGGKAIVKITLKEGAAVVKTFELNIPFDKDQDKIADRWEKEKVQQWNQQYGTNEFVGTGFFQPVEDKELRDPDGAGNADGGANLPEHKTAGDSLTVLQEYRGFMLDGGGHDGAGANGHPGGHIRLNPAEKELLVEVDSLALQSGATPGIQNPPTGGLNGLLADVSLAFSDIDKGGGIRMYWVRDEDALPHVTFADDAAWQTYLAVHRNPMLRAEFLHLLLAADSPAAVSRQGGTTMDVSATKDENGSVVFVDRRKTFADDNNYHFDTSLAKATTHELVHLLLIEPQTVAGQTAWDAAEHELDPNEDGIVDLNSTIAADGDEPFLMYIANTDENNGVVMFSNVTRREINVAQKQGLNP